MRLSAIAIVNTNGGDNDIDNEDDDCGDLRYGQCLITMVEHERWLVNLLRRHLLRDVVENQHRYHDIVVGYLSDNSPDLLLSVLVA